MKKNLGPKPFLFPMPAYMVGTYNEDNSEEIMMMSWGGICSEDMVALNLHEDDKTFENIKKNKAFTIAVPSIKTLEDNDYFRSIIRPNIPDKFKQTGLHAQKSDNVNAPIIQEFPLTIECTLEDIEDEPYGIRVLGKIENVLIEDIVLNEDGSFDPKQLDAFSYDQMNDEYYSIGSKLKWINHFLRGMNS